MEGFSQEQERGSKGGGGYFSLGSRVSNRRVENRFSRGRNVVGGGVGGVSVTVVVER